jgi:hypothetical protein
VSARGRDPTKTHSERGFRGRVAEDGATRGIGWLQNRRHRVLVGEVVVPWITAIASHVPSRLDAQARETSYAAAAPVGRFSIAVRLSIAWHRRIRHRRVRTAAFAARRSIRSSGTSAARGGAPVIRDEVHRYATGCLASALLPQLWFSRREAVGGGGISRAEDAIASRRRYRTEVPPKKSRGG